MPPKKRNPSPDEGAWLGGYVDPKVVDLFDASYYSTCGRARAGGKPAPTRLQYLAKIVWEYLTQGKPYEL
jgi:hypothetical protein